MSSAISVATQSAFTIPIMMHGSPSIGRRIAELRKERGYTQKELAERMNIAWTLVSDYERGKLRLNDAVLRKLSNALEVSSDEILGLKPPDHSAPKPSLRIVRRVTRIASLPSSKQKALLQIIDGFLKGEAAGRPRQ